MDTSLDRFTGSINTTSKEAYPNSLKDFLSAETRENKFHSSSDNDYSDDSSSSDDN